MVYAFCFYVLPHCSAQVLHGKTNVVVGGDNDQVETHVSEPTEPVDVRKNRQLTLDNMKLHRELEKLKQTANEHDHVKKELRCLRTKYDDEQKARNRLEQAMDMQNKKGILKT